MGNCKIKLVDYNRFVFECEHCLFYVCYDVEEIFFFYFKTFFGLSQLNQGDGFLHIFTVTFLLFIAPAGGANHAGNY